MEPKHPGDVIREKLAELELSVNEAARKTGMTGATLSRIINRKQSLTADTAKKISILCQCDPLTLLIYQNLYDLAQLEGGEQ